MKRIFLYTILVLLASILCVSALSVTNWQEHAYRPLPVTYVTHSDKIVNGHSGAWTIKFTDNNKTYRIDVADVPRIIDNGDYITEILIDVLWDDLGYMSNPQPPYLLIFPTYQFTDLKCGASNMGQLCEETWLEEPILIRLHFILVLNGGN